MKKVLLIGEYYSTNLGDPVLCRTVQKHIELEYPEVEIVAFDMSGKISYDVYFEVERYSCTFKNFLRLANRLPRLFHKSVLYRAYLKDETRYIRTLTLLDKVLKKNRFDVAIFAGGSLFMDYFAGITYCIVRKLQRKGIKVLFHACGLSKLDIDAIKLVSKALKCKNVLKISLRDSYSRFVELFRCGKVAVQTYDSALMCSQYFSAAESKCAEYGIGIIGLPQFYQAQKGLVDFFIRSGKRWKVFTNGSNADDAMAKQILSDAGVCADEQSNYIVDRPTTAEELVHVVTSFEKVISFRMHSLIIALSYGIPNYGLVWEDKVLELYRNLGVDDFCERPDGSIDVAAIIERLDCSEGMVVAAVKQAGLNSRECLIRAIGEVKGTGEVCDP